jgi:hypothetical protein
VHNEDVWIEPVLARHLGPAAAPEGLWEGIAQPRVQRSAVSSVRLAWAFAGALLVAVLVWGFHLRGDASVENQALEFRSDKADQIQAWVKSDTGLDVPLHDSASARLIGAGIVKGGAPAARIIYRVGAKDIALLVASVGTAPASAAIAGDKIFSWTARGQRYTVECSDADELKIGCLLCHAGA